MKQPIPAVNYPVPKTLSLNSGLFLESILNHFSRIPRTRLVTVEFHIPLQGVRSYSLPTDEFNELISVTAELILRANSLI